jgi:hypothetical protein
MADRTCVDCGVVLYLDEINKCKDCIQEEIDEEYGYGEGWNGEYDD